MMSKKLQSLLFPSIKNIFFLAIFAGVLRQGNQLLNADGDLGHHLAMGNLILTSRSIPQTDPFSFRTEEILAIPHEWLVQTGFALLNQWFGLTGIVVFCALIIAATFTIVLQESFKRSEMLVAGVIMTGLTLTASTIHWISRPHLLTFLLLAVWTYSLEALLRGEHRRWWVLPTLMLIWANLHGMFVIGLLTLGIAATGYGWERFAEHKPETLPGLGRELALAGITSTFATFLTPSGWHLWQTIFHLANSSYITGITSEYMSPDFHQPGTWSFLVLLGITLASAALCDKKLGMPRALQLASWTLIGLYSARNIPLAAIVLAPISAELLANWIQQSPALDWLVSSSRGLERIEKQLKGWLWAVCGVCLTILLINTGINPDMSGKAYQFLPEKFPVLAVDWLEAHPQSGRMFNEFDWGGYLLYRLWPEQKIFMDGHTHIYGDAMSREYVTAMAVSPGWENILEQYNIEWAILSNETKLVSALEQAGWHVLYRDKTSAILRR